MIQNHHEIGQVDNNYDYDTFTLKFMRFQGGFEAKVKLYGKKEHQEVEDMFREFEYDIDL